MSWIGVITGDIVNSTEILNSGNRDKLLATLHQAVEDINTFGCLGCAKLEIYRGDSFQIIIESAMDTLHAAICIRATLIGNSESKNRWDARLGLGIGESEYIANNIAESDGEVFRLSGQAFDSLGKKNRLAILTPDSDFNNELKISTAFADDIISGWTKGQASIVRKLLLTRTTQKTLAEMEGKSPQTVSKLLSTAKFELITLYNKRFEEKSHYINH